MLDDLAKHESRIVDLLYAKADAEEAALKKARERSERA